MIPREPKQPANVWRFVDDKLVTLYSVDDDEEFGHHEVRSEFDHEEKDYWKRHVLDLDDFHSFRNELNLSLDAAKKENGLDNALGKKSPLVPRKFDNSKNDKTKNKRVMEKPTPVKLDLQPKIKADQYQKKKADPPRKAYQGKTKRQEAPKDRYKNPRTVGRPVEPVQVGENPKGRTKQLGSQTVVKRPAEGFKEEKEVQYEPRSVPRYQDIDQNVDSEEIKFNFKSGQPVRKTQGPKTELRDAHGRMPDEFHNYEFERHHPELIQPVHYDHYDPLVEGFFGSGYSFEPMEQVHHETEEMATHAFHQMGESRFMPGVFGQGDLDHMSGYHHRPEGPYHPDVVVKDVSDPEHIADERATMDIYMPTYSTP